MGIRSLRELLGKLLLLKQFLVLRKRASQRLKSVSVVYREKCGAGHVGKSKKKPELVVRLWILSGQEQHNTTLQALTFRKTIGSKSVRKMKKESCVACSWCSFPSDSTSPLGFSHLTTKCSTSIHHLIVYKLYVHEPDCIHTHFILIVVLL